MTIHISSTMLQSGDRNGHKKRAGGSANPGPVYHFAIKDDQALQVWLGLPGWVSVTDFGVPVIE